MVVRPDFPLPYGRGYALSAPRAWRGSQLPQHKAQGDADLL